LGINLLAVIPTNLALLYKIDYLTPILIRQSLYIVPLDDPYGRSIMEHTVLKRK